MSTEKVITVNGRSYDAATGLPIDNATAADVHRNTKPVTPRQSAQSMHATTQRAKTLRRSSVKKPAANPTRPKTQAARRGRTMDIARSNRVQKFAPHPATAKKAMDMTKPAKKKEAPARAASHSHPVAKKATAAHAKKVAPKPVAKRPTQKQTKDAAVSKAMAATKPHIEKTPFWSPWKKGILIGAIIIGVIGAMAWGVYRFVPSVSVYFAAQQADVAAEFPSYVPDGYSFQQPVTHSDGEVVLTFHSNSNSGRYTITQTKSAWDSSALLNNMVKTSVGENYLTTTEKGLTIYSYSNRASWVNGGVLYTVANDATLSNDQIRRIATSL